MTTCVSAYESERNRSKSSWPAIQPISDLCILCGDFIQQVIATGVQRRTGRIPQAELYHLIVHLDHLHIILKHRRFTVNA